MGYTVSIEAVLQLAKTNYDIAERYAEVASKITRTDDAASHLTDKNGEATAADSDVVAMLDEFFEYLKTTTSRYYLTSEQLAASAKAYVEHEDEQKGVYERTMSDYEAAGFGDNDLNEEEDTDRPDGANPDQADGFGTEDTPAENDEGAKEYLEELEDDEDDEEGGN